jgi:hypothetical protein
VTSRRKISGAMSGTVATAVAWGYDDAASSSQHPTRYNLVFLC